MTTGPMRFGSRVLKIVRMVMRENATELVD